MVHKNSVSLPSMLKYESLKIAYRMKMFVMISSIDSKWCVLLGHAEAYAGNLEVQKNRKVADEWAHVHVRFFYHCLLGNHNYIQVVGIPKCPPAMIFQLTRSACEPGPLLPALPPPPSSHPFARPNSQDPASLDKPPPAAPSRRCFRAGLLTAFAPGCGQAEQGAERPCCVTWRACPPLRAG